MCMCFYVRIRSSEHCTPDNYSMLLALTISGFMLRRQVIRPRIVSTRIDTEYDTYTVTHSVTNTIFVNPVQPRFGPAAPTAHHHYY